MNVNDAFAPGTRVQVRNRFDGSWSTSPFEVAETTAHTTTAPTYRLRRLSDGAVLPADFISDDVRTAET